MKVICPKCKHSQSSNRSSSDVNSCINCQASWMIDPNEEITWNDDHVKAAYYGYSSVEEFRLFGKEPLRPDEPSAVKQKDLSSWFVFERVSDWDGPQKSRFTWNSPYEEPDPWKRGFRLQQIPREKNERK